MTSAGNTSGKTSARQFVGNITNLIKPEPISCFSARMWQKFFPTEESVNQALRSLIDVARKSAGSAEPSE